MGQFMYETMYILRPDLGEEIVDEAIGQYQNIIQEQGAEILETQHRGKRRLAYDIQKHREGIYIQMNYTGPGKAVAPLERAMRLSENVLRYLTIKQDIDEEIEVDLEASATTDAPSTPPPGAA
ncbi:MAG: 30S ribosomal protein S6 [Cyanobacteria bacterium]|nr:30S ribosomal protein S6 [Cyanobacteriota bacterium]MDA0865254.1 30S ribosomal protein S6 [Cyanobacteriota bacterium]